MKTASGKSILVDSYGAAQEAIDQATSQLRSKPDVVLISSTIGHELEDVIDAIYEELGDDIQVVGASSAGSISNAFSDESMFSISLLCICCEDIQAHVLSAKDVNDDIETVARQLVTDMENHAKGESSVVLFFIDHRISASQFLTKTQDMMKSYIPFFGGLSGNNFKMNDHSYQIVNHDIFSGGVSALILTGDINYKTFSTHGSVPIGEEIMITEVNEDNTMVLKINDRPALDVIEEFYQEKITKENLGQAVLYIGFGKNISRDEEEDKYVVSTMMYTDFEKRGFQMPLSAHVGDKIRIMRRDIDSILEQSIDEAKTLSGFCNKVDVHFIFHIECAGRGIVIMDEMMSQDMISSLHRGLNKETPIFGAYVFGECAPLTMRGKIINYPHSYTSTITAFY